MQFQEAVRWYFRWCCDDKIAMILPFPRETALTTLKRYLDAKNYCDAEKRKKDKIVITLVIKKFIFKKGFSSLYFDYF